MKKLFLLLGLLFIIGCSEKEYKVKFYIDEEIVKEVILSPGDRIDFNFDNPSKDGFVFKYWSKSKNGRKFDYNSKINEDTNLHAVFVEIFEVEFTTVETVQVESGSRVEEIDAPSIENFIFSHWSLEPDGEAYNFNGRIYKDIKLYPVYFEFVLVKFIYGENSDFSYIKKGLKVDKPRDPMIDGFVFEGWYEENSAEEFDFNTPINKETILTAKIRQVNFTGNLETTGKIILKQINELDTQNLYFEVEFYYENEKMILNNEIIKQAYSLDFFNISSAVEILENGNFLVNLDTSKVVFITKDNITYTALHNFNNSFNELKYELSNNSGQLRMNYEDDNYYYEYNLFVNDIPISLTSVNYKAYILNNYNSKWEEFVFLDNEESLLIKVNDKSKYKSLLLVDNENNFYYADMNITLHHLVSFYVEEENYLTEVVKDNDLLTESINPISSSGRQFLYWSLSKDEKNSFDFVNTKVTDDIILYAIFDEESN